MSIYSLGSGNWGIYRAGTSVGESTHSATSATDVDAGSETTLSTNSIAAYNDNLQYEDLSGHWRGGTPAFSALDNPYNGVAYSGSVTGAGSHIWAGRNCAGGASVSRGTTPGPSATTPPVLSLPAPTSSSPAAAMISPAQASVSLLPIVGRLAALNGEANPTAITYVATTRAKAANLTGGAVDSDQAVYMVQVKGQFNGAAAHHPKGLAAPHGTVLTVVIDATTMQVTDWGLTNTTAPLNQVGRVQAVG